MLDSRIRRTKLLHEIVSKMISRKWTYRELHNLSVFLDATEDEKIMAVTTIVRPELITDILLGKPRRALNACNCMKYMAVRKHFLPAFYDGTHGPVPHPLSNSWLARLDNLDKLESDGAVWSALFDMGFRPHCILGTSLTKDVSGDFSFSWEVIDGLKRNLRT